MMGCSPVSQGHVKSDKIAPFFTIRFYILYLLFLNFELYLSAERLLYIKVFLYSPLSFLIPYI